MIEQQWRSCCETARTNTLRLLKSNWCHEYTFIIYHTYMYQILNFLFPSAAHTQSKVTYIVWIFFLCIYIYIYILYTYVYRYTVYLCASMNTLVRFPVRYIPPQANLYKYINVKYICIIYNIHYIMYFMYFMYYIYKYVFYEIAKIFGCDQWGMNKCTCRVQYERDHIFLCLLKSTLVVREKLGERVNRKKKGNTFSLYGDTGRTDIHTIDYNLQTHYVKLFY